MECPVCRTDTLSNIELEEMLYGYKCSSCGGCWIKGYQYWKWLKAHGDILPEQPAGSEGDLSVPDSRQAKVCIECGHLMIRNRVGHGVPFYLDRCSTCGGIWLDNNEWEILKSRNLHDEIHLIFTAAWQSGNRRKEQEANQEKHLAEILGKEEHDELKKFKSWICGHPEKDLIIGYILNG